VSTNFHYTKHEKQKLDKTKQNIKRQNETYSYQATQPLPAVACPGLESWVLVQALGHEAAGDGLDGLLEVSMRSVVG